jgi:hypothetical protein
MTSRTLVALAVGLLLIAAEFMAMRYDARHGVADYQGEVATALPAHR